MSSSDTSPVKSRFSGSDLDFFSNQFDPSYTAEISNKMRVPKKIRVVGGHEVESGDHDSSGGGGSGSEINGNSNWRRRDGDDKVQMQVPDRIIVTGQESHRGAKALPRELQLETVVMPPEPEMIRIQTPPRSITLHSQNMNHQSSRGGSGASSTSYRSEEDDETLIVETDEARFGSTSSSNNQQGHSINGGGAVMGYNYGVGMGIGSNSGIPGDSIVRSRGKRVSNNAVYNTTGNSEMDENDEIDHLREQLSRMNRRLLAVEEDGVERKERERYIVLAGLLYVAYKTCAWLLKTGSSHH